MAALLIKQLKMMELYRKQGGSGGKQGTLTGPERLTAADALRSYWRASVGVADLVRSFSSVCSFRL